MIDTVKTGRIPFLRIVNMSIPFIMISNCLTQKKLSRNKRTQYCPYHTNSTEDSDKQKNPVLSISHLFH